MKKMIIASFFLVAAVIGRAQDKGSSEVYLNWNMATPLQHNFVKDFSVNGVATGYNFFISNNLAIGGELGWNNFNTYYPRQTSYSKTGAFTTDMYTYVFALPVTATVTKYFPVSKLVSPYVKLGLGTLYSEQNKYYNIYEETNSNWGFTAVPEMGVHVKTSADNHWSLNVGVQYHYATNGYSGYDIHNIQTLNFNIGASWKLR
ncbi:MAG: outer membrane beta-barrel protein [Agriterribacter sp.]